MITTSRCSCRGATGVHLGVHPENGKRCWEAQRLRLALEALEPFRVRSRFRRQHLEGHVAAELGVGISSFQHGSNYKKPSSLGAAFGLPSRVGRASMSILDFAPILDPQRLHTSELALVIGDHNQAER